MAYNQSWDEHVTAINQKPPAPSQLGPDGKPISYEANLNRKKTQKWVDARKADYGGGGWGEDEYDEYDDDEPPPPISKDAPPVVVTRPRQSSLVHEDLRGPSAGMSSQEPRSSSQAETRPLHLHIQPQSQSLYPGHGDGRTYSLTQAPMYPPGGDSRTYSLTQPPSLMDDSSRTRSLDSSVMSNKFMPGNRQHGPSSPTQAHMSRGSNLSDELPPPGPIEPRPGSSASTRSSGARKLIRPADIYKKLAEQKDLARKSQESDRPISDSLSSGSGPKLETSPPVANAIPVAPIAATVTAPESAPVPAVALIAAPKSKSPSPPPVQAVMAAPVQASIPTPAASIPAQAAQQPNPDMHPAQSHLHRPPVISKSNPYADGDMPVVDLSSLQRSLPDLYEQRPHQYGGQLETLTESAEEKSITSFKMHDDDDGGRKSSETSRLKSVTGSLARSIPEETIPEVPKRFSRSPELPDLNFGDNNDFRASLWTFPSDAKYTDNTPLPPLPAKDHQAAGTLKSVPSGGLRSVVDKAFDDANQLNPTTPIASPGVEKAQPSIDDTVSEPPTPALTLSVPGSAGPEPGFRRDMAGPDPQNGPGRAPAVQPSLYHTTSHEVLLSAVTPTTPSYSSSSASAKEDNTPKENKPEAKNLTLDIKSPSNAKPAILSPPPPPPPAKDSPTHAPAPIAKAAQEQTEEKSPASAGGTTRTVIPNRLLEPKASIPNSPVELPLRHSRQDPIELAPPPKIAPEADEDSDTPALDQLDLSDTEDEAEGGKDVPAKTPAKVAAKHTHSASVADSVKSEAKTDGAGRQSVMSDLLDDYDGYWALQEDEFGNRQSVYVGPATDEPPPPPPLPLELINKVKAEESTSKEPGDGPKPAPLNIAKAEQAQGAQNVTPSQIPLPDSARPAESPVKESPTENKAVVPTIIHTPSEDDSSISSPKQGLRHRFSWEAGSSTEDMTKKSDKDLDKATLAQKNFDAAALRTSVTLEVVQPPPEKEREEVLKEEDEEDDNSHLVPPSTSPRLRPVSELEPGSLFGSPGTMSLAETAVVATAVSATAVAAGVATQRHHRTDTTDHGLGIETMRQAPVRQFTAGSTSEQDSPVVQGDAPISYHFSDGLASKKLPSFREILSIPSPEQRIKMYNQSTQQISSSTTGLGQWITVMSASIAPEHIQNYREGAPGLSGPPSSGGPASQAKPYYEQYMDAYDQPPPSRRDDHQGHHHGLPMRSQMPSKGRDFLQSANKLFNIGKSKLRGSRSEDDHR